jgi:hypothetical protein
MDGMRPGVRKERATGAREGVGAFVYVACMLCDCRTTGFASYLCWTFSSLVLAGRSVPLVASLVLLSFSPLLSFHPYTLPK